MTKVSIVVPIYNVENYLDRCVKSLLNQTLKDIEIILVDDESPDNCPKMCDDYAKCDARVKVIHKKNGGLGYARNSGLEVAKGEFVAFVDSDDFVDLKMYETLYDLAKKHELDTVYSSCVFYKDENTHSFKKEVDKFETFIGKEEIDNFLLEMVGPLPNSSSDVKYMMSVWKAIYSKRILDEKGIKFCSEREFISEDILFHIDYLKNTQKIGFSPNYFYYYQINETSLSRIHFVERYEKNKILLTEIKRRLSLYFQEEKFMKHYQRLMFLYYRTSFLSNCKLARKNKGEKYELITKNVKDKFWKDMYNGYPYWKLPLKHRLFFVCSRSKIFGLLLFHLKLN